jgi:hypothetical protein
MRGRFDSEAFTLFAVVDVERLGYVINIGRNWVPNQKGTRDFSLGHSVQTHHGAHPTFYKINVLSLQ